LVFLRATFMSTAGSRMTWMGQRVARTVDEILSNGDLLLVGAHAHRPLRPVDPAHST
jgi:hypothetical protein